MDAQSAVSRRTDALKIRAGAPLSQRPHHHVPLRLAIVTGPCRPFNRYNRNIPACDRVPERRTAGNIGTGAGHGDWHTECFLVIRRYRARWDMAREEVV